MNIFKPYVVRKHYNGVVLRMITQDKEMTATLFGLNKNNSLRWPKWLTFSYRNLYVNNNFQKQPHCSDRRKQTIVVRALEFKSYFVFCFFSFVKYNFIPLMLLYMTKCMMYLGTKHGIC